MLLRLCDKSDGYIYDIEFSQEDVRRIMNMRILRKSRIELPSVEGTASLDKEDLTVMYKNHGLDSVSISFSDFQLAAENPII